VTKIISTSVELLDDLATLIASPSSTSS